MVKCSSDACLTSPQEPGASVQDLLTAKKFSPRVRLSSPMWCWKEIICTLLTWDSQNAQWSGKCGCAVDEHRDKRTLFIRFEASVPHGFS